MKEYDVCYTNLFHMKKNPNIRVLDVLVYVNRMYETLNVLVEYENNHAKSWTTMGNPRFENLSKSDISELIFKLQSSSNYYMSDDDYEIIGVKSFRNKGENYISVAVAIEDGYFETVVINMTKVNKSNLSSDVYNTEWEYLTEDTIAEFLKRVKNFLLTE